MTKRVLYFVGTNIAVLLVFSIIMRVFGLDQVLGQNGGGYIGSLIFAAIFGMTGSFISLAMSKSMAKRMSGARVIDSPTNETERWLVSTVHRQAAKAGIGVPEVAIVDSSQVNAFATGMNKNNALVAVYQGLLDSMTREEAEAVMAHEISHVANGDMVTLALIQGVVNTFVIFFARIIGQLVDRVVFKNERGHGIGFMLTYFAAQFVLGILASAIVLYFSRKREFRADAGAAQIENRQSMIAALQRLQSQHQPSVLPDQLAAFGISGGLRQGFKKWFASHPPLDERIDALRNSA